MVDLDKSRFSASSSAQQVFDPSQALNSDDLEKSWENIQGRMRADLGDTIWRSWIRNLRLVDITGGVIKIGAESRFVCTRVSSQFTDRLRQHCHVEWGNVKDIQIDVLRGGQLPPPLPSSGPVRASDQPVSPPRVASVYDEVSSKLDPRMTFDNFVVGNPNNFAYAVATRVAEIDKPIFNPLFLYGGVGLGKTHLMHAIAWEKRKRFPDLRIVYLTAEVFMNRFIKALRHKNTIQFKEEFRSVDVLMIDDVQFIGGKDSTQEEFFHTFNALTGHNKQIIISADKSPTDLSGVEERLKSRFNCGMVADIHPTTFELRLGILQSKAEKDGLDLPQNVAECLAHKITTNIRELEGALNRLSAYSSLMGKPISIDSIYDALGDILRASNKQVSIAEIQREVAQHFNIKLNEMHSKRRSKNIVHPRQVAMYLSKTLTSKSYPEIGRHFGGRDHTTVMYATQKIEKAMIEDHAINDDIKIIKSLLNVS